MKFEGYKKKLFSFPQKYILFPSLMYRLLITSEDKYRKKIRNDYN